MATRHIVTEGECISSISFEYGFFRETLESYSDNAALKQRRKNLNSLAPGDVVVVPDKRAKSIDIMSGASHRFRRKGVPEFLHLRFLDDQGEPRGGLHYRLTVDGVKLEGTTDSGGAIRRRISPAAREIELELRDGERVQRFQLGLGKLPPASEPAGLQARLKNLGVYDGEVTGELDDDTRAALRRFQELHGLPRSGEADDATLSKLAEIYEPKAPPA